MKLTQKTLFQCFEKSHSQSPVINSLSNSQIKTSSELQECQIPQQDFLLPIHIHQYDNLSVSTINSFPLLNKKKFTDDNFIYSKHEFYRICPTIINDQINLPKLQFIKITSIERQMELFKQYTNDQTIIDWKRIFQDLQDYRKKAIEQNQYEQLLWTELYRPKTSKAYLGNHTRQVKRLNQWFSYWKIKLQNEQPKKILSKKRKRLRDDDDEDFSDNSNSCHYSKPEYPQLIFIHGQGTTSLVHALAEEYNFKITEINGSQSRARTSLLKQLEQVNSHHHLTFKRCPSDTIQSQDKLKENLSSLLPPLKKKVKNECNSIKSYFNQSKTIDNDESCNQKKDSNILINKTNISKKQRKKIQQEYSTIIPDNNILSSIQVEKTSFILFDEIETLTIDDNFWSCLKKLLETAKKPIILTSNSRINPENAIINLSKIGYYELIHLESNECELICCFLRLILLIEMIEISSFSDLILLFEYCSSDLRQTLLTLQFLVQSLDVKNDSKSLTEINNSIKFPSSHIFDSIHYSYRNQELNESQLKIFFDDLTKKYTSEYDQSYQLLTNQIQTNPQRLELYDTFKLFMQEQEIDNIIDNSSFYLDYRPYIRQICQNEQIRAKEFNSNGRFRHNLGFRGCSLQWSDFEILSTGLD